MATERSLTRRTVARVTGAATAVGALAVGGVFDAFEFTDGDGGSDGDGTAAAFDLPAPEADDGLSVERAIERRRSRREYTDEPLSRTDLGQLCWAAQGITEERGVDVDFRAAPSAGATYPLALFVVIGDPGVEDMAEGIYRYEPGDHRLRRRRSGAFQDGLRDAALGQSWVGEAAIDIVITAIDERTTQRYGDRGRERYVPMEAGHVGENIYLQAESLDLATVVVGAFHDDDVRSLLDLPERHRPLYVVPVGHRR